MRIDTMRLKNIATINIIIIVLFLLSCESKQKDIPLGATETSSAELTARLFDQGDLTAYSELSQNFSDSPNSNFLYVALVTANKFDHPSAYRDVYLCLTDLMHKKSGTELDNLDPKTRKLALEYLSSGAALGERECMQILARELESGKYLPRDSVKAAKLLKNAGGEIEDE